MNRTKIEWALNPDGTPGYTWNPITGCLNHVDGMCKGGGFPCYAYRLANTRLREWYLANKNLPGFTPGLIPYGEVSQMYIQKCFNNPFYPRFWPERVSRLLDRNSAILMRHPKPRGIFVCDMSDLFGIGVPSEWTRQILQAIRDNGSDRFYLLTKQPQNLIKWSPFPENCWVGVTATNQKAHNEAVVVLSYIKASIKFISHEPLLERISLHEPYSPEDAYDWDIIGSQTKPYKPPKIEWVQEIIESADKAGIPVFLKPNLKPLWGIPPLEDDVILRQEMPK